MLVNEVYRAFFAPLTAITHFDSDTSVRRSRNDTSIKCGLKIYFERLMNPKAHTLRRYVPCHKLLIIMR